MEPTISFTVTGRNAEGKNTRRVSHPRKETKISVRGGAERAKGKAPGAYRTHFTHVVLLHPIYGSFDRPYRVANNPRARYKDSSEEIALITDMEINARFELLRSFSSERITTYLSVQSNRDNKEFRRN